MASFPNLASSSSFFFFFFFLLCFSVSHSLVYNVGGGRSPSWTLPAPMDYNGWASSRIFRVNDVLRFSYLSEVHNVMMVSAEDYERCSATAPLQVYSNGNSLVRLQKAGTYYFICGIPGHCDAGMKMKVDVRP